MQSMAGAKGLTVADNIFGRLTNAAIFRYTSWLFWGGEATSRYHRADLGSIF